MLSRQDIMLLISLSGIALISGWLSGAFGWSFFAGASIWSVVQQRKLRLQLKALRTFTDALPDAALVIDSSGNIESSNVAAQKLLNLNPSDRGNHLASLVRDPGFSALIRGQIEGELVEFSSPFNDSQRLEARRIDMSTEDMVTERDDSTESVHRNMILVRDVTELNRLLSMRQDFIANVSHELRTPLTVVVGYVDTLLDEDLLPEEQIELISRLLSPTNRMRALVDDLLLLTQLESSPVPTPEELVVVNMENLLAAVTADGRALSGDRHQIDIEQRSRAQVLGIESELHSACLNLVTNAVRYSPDGGTITLSWEDVPGGARFAVKDQGMGIPSEHLSRITERFYRVDLAQARVRGGTGLGLAIVKHVLKRHNTQLQVDSKLATGSTFFCEFSDSQLARFEV